MEFLIQLDTWMLLGINSAHHPALDEIFSWITGRFTWIPLYAVMLYLLIRKERSNSWISLLCVIGMITISDQIASSLFKPLLMRPRPCHLDELKPLLHLVNNYCGGAYGFYSSHASNTFALFVFWGARSGKPLAILLCLYALANAYSRIYLGVHYPSDVLTGILAGFICARLFIIIEAKIKARVSLTLKY